MTYISLGPRRTVAAADMTGLNPGNWTNAFSPAVLGFFVNQYECYHIVCTQVPADAMGQLFLGAYQWGFTFPVTGTEWDPAQPMLLNPGVELDVFWNFPASGTPPLVTAWFRYDPAVPGNQA
jgi:hypothetical protein